MNSLIYRVVIVGLLLPVAARARQDGDGLDITIRSGIDMAEKQKRDHDKEYAASPARRRIYFLARISEENGAEKLVKPVDASGLAKEVTRQLEAQGFHAAQRGQKPEIVITVKYGRGYLNNPYMHSDEDKQYTPLSNTDRFGESHFDDKFVGLYESLLSTSYEKLIIQVRAWAYPPPKDPKQTEELLWATTIFVDDPDHRDLNDIAEQMLAAGAPFFDRHVDKEHEIVVHTGLPEGHVKVGTPEVVGTKSK